MSARSQIARWAIGIVIGVPIFFWAIAAMSNTKREPVPSTRVVTLHKAPPPVGGTEKRASPASALKGLEKNRDEMERVTFYQAKGRNLLSSSIELYIAAPDGSAPFLRVRPVYYGDNWVFYNKIKIMADKEIVFEKSFMRSDVVRTNSSSSVWETADYAAGPADIAALEKIAKASDVTVRYSGSESMHDHKLSKKERGRIAELLAAYKAVAPAIPTQ